MLFLSRDPEAQRECLTVVEEVVKSEGQYILGWRDVPVNADCLGPVARDAMPAIKQVFVSAVSEFATQDDFERKLYLIRKYANRIVKERLVRGHEIYYPPSFSSRTVIYKGMLLSEQVDEFYTDLKDPRVVSAIGLVHSRFSTNTFPTWELAHPYRMVAHNGEINTLRGNRNWMRAREATIQSPYFEANISKLAPLVTETGSDSAAFDNALEFLVMGGRSLPHAIMMMIPEAYTKDPSMTPEKKAFYEYHACLMEPWDGPAAIAFTDGVVVGAVLDRNGLRPGRYWVTRDDRLIYASETGVLDIPVTDVAYKGKMQPGKMLLVDTDKQRLISDDEIKAQVAAQKPYARWVEQNVIEISKLPDPPEGAVTQPDHETLMRRQQAFGYTLEDLRLLIAPMAAQGRGGARFHGQRRAACRAERAPAAALQLLQAAFCAGHQPACGLYTRGYGDEHAQLYRRVGQHPGRDARPRPHGAHPPPRDHQRGAGEAAPCADGRLPHGDAAHRFRCARRRGGHGEGAERAVRQRVRGVPRRLRAHHPVGPHRRREPRANPRAARSRRSAPPSHPRGAARRLGHRHRDRRGARGAALRPAQRLRRGRHQPVSRVRNHRRHGERRHAAGRTDAARRAHRRRRRATTTSRPQTRRY